MKAFNVEDIRKKILESDDRVFDSVVVPEWGGVEVPTISLSMQQRKRVRQKAIRVKEDGSYNVDTETMQIQAMIEACKDHKTEKQIFTQGDAKTLWEKNSNAVAKVAQKILADSGMSADGDEQVDEAKNS
ncbi:MAG: hypothetical protein ACOCQD_03110 [archaeon]